MNIGVKIKDFENSLLDLNSQINDLKEKLNLSKPSVLPKIENEEYDRIIDLKYLQPDSLIIILAFKNIITKTQSFYIIKGEVQMNVYNQISNIHFISDTFTKIPLIGEDAEIITNLIVEVSPSNLIYIVPENANQFLKKKVNDLLLEIKYDNDAKSFNILNTWKIDRVNFYIKDIIFDYNEKYLYLLEVLDPRVEKDPEETIQTNKAQISRYTILKKSFEFRYMNIVVFPKLDIDWTSFLGWSSPSVLMVINNNKLNLEKVNHYGQVIELKKEERNEVGLIKKTFELQNKREYKPELDNKSQIIKFVNLNNQNSYYRLLDLIPNGSLRIRIINELGKIICIPQHFGKKNYNNLNNILEPYGLIYSSDIKSVVEPIEADLTSNLKDFGINNIHYEKIKYFKEVEDCKEIPVYFQKINQ